MHLSRPIAVVLALFSLTGCHDAAAPRPLVRAYGLVAIDEHPLPVTFSGTDFSTTVLSGTLTLDGAGHAGRVTRYRDYSANTGMTYDRTETRSDSYVIAHDSISVGSFGTCNAPCLPNDIGVFTGGMVTLTSGFGARTAPVYKYYGRLEL